MEWDKINYQLDEKEINNLFVHSSFVRNQIENLKKTTNLFKEFPNGYCSRASLWLYDYLQSKGYNSIKFCFREPFGTIDMNHVWLHIGDLNIDITGDQFNKKGFCFDSIYVERDNEFYSHYKYEDKKSYVGECYMPLYNRYKNVIDERELLYNKLGISFADKAMLAEYVRGNLSNN